MTNANVPEDIAKVDADTTALVTDEATLNKDEAAPPVVTPPVVTPPVVAPLLMGTVAARTLTAGQTYTQSLTASGGVPPYSYAVAGLGGVATISGSAVTGTAPLVAQTNTMTWTVTDDTTPTPLSNTGPPVTWTTVAGTTPPVVTPPATGVVPLAPASLNAPTTLQLDDEFTSFNTSIWSPHWFEEGGKLNNYPTYAANATISAGNGLALICQSSSSCCSVNSLPWAGGGFSISPAGGGTGGAHPGKTGPVYIEYKMTLPAAANGTINNWVNAWMGGQNWPEDGEIDVMEGLGGSAACHTHWGSGASDQGGLGKSVNSSPGTHTYAVYWTTSECVFVYDGVEVFTQAFTPAAMASAMTHPMGLIFGNQGPAACTAYMHYVRVWQ